MIGPMRDTCLRHPEVRLVQNRVQTHWRHCPECDPAWVTHVEDTAALEAFRSMRILAADPRGRPNLNGTRI
jgi:hypothetical protein